MTSPASDPQQFPWHLDAKQRSIHFVKLTREMIAQAAFLDHRATGANSPTTAVSLSDLQIALTEAPNHRAPAYIFHTSFCSSTLLSRCLDAPGRALAIKEPQILVDLSAARRFGGAAGKQSFEHAFDVANALLARPFEDSERAIVKPSNGVNDLLFDVLERSPNSPVLLLFKDIRSFLLSVAKRGETGRRFIRALLHHPWGTDPRLSDMRRDQLAQLTDLQSAAIIWRLQTEAFSKALKKYPRTRIQALDANDFLKKPVEILKAVNAFFETGVNANAIAAVANGPLFTQDAKRLDQTFETADKAQKQNAVEAALGADIDNVITWVMQIPFPDATPIQTTLRNK